MKECRQISYYSVPQFYWSVTESYLTWIANVIKIHNSHLLFAHVFRHVFIWILWQLHIKDCQGVVVFSKTFYFYFVARPKKKNSRKIVILKSLHCLMKGFEGQDIFWRIQFRKHIRYTVYEVHYYSVSL